MKKYDFKNVKKFCQKYSDHIDSVQLGMQEDWYWTAETIYEEGTFKVNLDDKNLDIAGIFSSDWATPSMKVDFKDGTEEMFDCFT